MAPNTALLTIPAYYLLVMWPSKVALDVILKQHSPKNHNNVNPRGVDTIAAYKKLLGPQDFAKWERCKAANAQGYEVFPLVAVSILAGLHAGLPERVMNGTGLGLVLLRWMYNMLYIRTETRKNSYWRTANFFTQMATCLSVLVAAALQ